MSSDNDQESPMIGLPDPDSDPQYARLRSALGESGAALAPRPGWEARVWARIDGERAAAPAANPRWGWFASGAMLVAAAVALLLWQPWRSESKLPAAGVQRVAMAPTISIRQGAQVMRGTTAAPGDTLVVRHDVDGAAVWVYFEDNLVSEGGGRLELTLERPGTYHVISTIGPGRAPAALDAALATLVTAGTAHHRHTVEVR